jgi:hypothetical protein
MCVTNNGKNEEGGAMLKFVRDAALTILGALVLEPTLRKIHFDVGPYLAKYGCASWYFLASMR